MAENKTNKNTDAFVPKIALGVAAHPDDLDFSSAGSVAAWTAQGAEVYYLILTNGDKGSADPSADTKALSELRRGEQRAAAKILGVRDVFFCNYEDGELMVSMDVKRDIARIIRTVRPDTVIAFDPTMIYDAERGFINHPDHRAAGQATLDAVYPLARDHMSFPELYQQEHLEPHNVSTVLLSNFQQQNFFVDITDSFDTKMKGLSAHTSQVPDTVKTETMLRSMAKKMGKKAGCTYAEGFMRIDVR